METNKKILVYGFGNPGRQDDGLGPGFAEMVDEWKQKNTADNIVVDSNYQLNVEDALEISEYDVVVFADATIEEDVEDFILDILDPTKAEVKYTLHAASPGYILELCHELYQKYPSTYLLRIKGYEWDFREGISIAASRNLNMAFNYFINWINNLN
jgi:hydrogenase maturation protease